MFWGTTSCPIEESFLLTAGAGQLSLLPRACVSNVAACLGRDAVFLFMSSFQDLLGYFILLLHFQGCLRKSQVLSHVLFSFGKSTLVVSKFE